MATFLKTQRIHNRAFLSDSQSHKFKTYTSKVFHLLILLIKSEDIEQNKANDSVKAEVFTLKQLEFCDMLNLQIREIHHLLSQLLYITDWTFLKSTSLTN